MRYVNVVEFEVSTTARANLHPTAYNLYFYFQIIHRNRVIEYFVHVTHHRRELGMIRKYFAVVFAYNTFDFTKQKC